MIIWAMKTRQIKRKLSLEKAKKVQIIISFLCFFKLFIEFRNKFGVEKDLQVICFS